MFEEHPAMLEILVALLQNQLLVIDTSDLGSRESIPALKQFADASQKRNHEIIWPDVIPGRANAVV